MVYGGAMADEENGQQGFETRGPVLSTNENGQQEFEFRRAVAPEGRVLSINQIVSYNLMRARRRHAWTQQDVALLLERYTGRPWSNASVSAAERAWQGGRARKFDANELIALTKIFDETLAFFFLPPEPEDYANAWVSMRQFEDGRMPQGATPEDPYSLMPLMPTETFLEAVGGTDPSLDFMDRMMRAYKLYLALDWLPSSAVHRMTRDEVEEVDWSEVVASQEADAEARTSSGVDLDNEGTREFIRSHSAEIALAIVENLHASGLTIAKIEDPSGSGARANSDSDGH